MTAELVAQRSDRKRTVAEFRERNKTISYVNFLCYVRFVPSLSWHMIVLHSTQETEIIEGERETVFLLSFVYLKLSFGSNAPGVIAT